jgi:7-cyano-7-deazaguanine tRNA-ribosyltransferase
MLVVAGLTVKNLKPRVWDPASQFYLPNLHAVMLSYADFHQQPGLAFAVKRDGIRSWLGVPDHVQVFIDNGAFFFQGRHRIDHFGPYEEFVASVGANWWPIPQDFIPVPRMTSRAQRDCYEKTMAVNYAYQEDGFVPVIHIGRQFDEYLEAVTGCEVLSAKQRIALGGIVPNLLRAPKALPYEEVIRSLRATRAAFPTQSIHIFGVGGTATLHLSALLGFDSIDSSGWRNRAARGIVQLPGRGDRLVAQLGSWRGRKPTASEWSELRRCPCPGCQLLGIEGLKASGMSGFEHRAVHNLFVLLEEAEWVAHHRAAGTYASHYEARLDNSVYLRYVREALQE